jgi:hypothetical protein
MQKMTALTRNQDGHDWTAIAGVRFNKGATNSVKNNPFKGVVRMGIGDIIALVSAITGMILAYPALLILLNVLFSQTTTRVADRLAHGMKWSFGVGVIVVIVGGIIISTLISAGSVPQLLGVLLYLLLSMWGTVGNAAIARVFGQRISAMSDRQPSTLMEMASGGCVLTLSFAFPLVGWFVVMPLISVITMGAMTLNLFSRRSSKTDDPASDEMTVAAATS